METALIEWPEYYDNIASAGSVTAPFQARIRKASSENIAPNINNPPRQANRVS
jgi:hypothetical protein